MSGSLRSKRGRMRAFLVAANKVLRILWSELAQNQVIRMLAMSVFYLWLQRQLNNFKNTIYDLIFTQIRFHPPEAQMMIRTFVSEKLMESAVGMEISTQDEGIGRSEVLHSEAKNGQQGSKERKNFYSYDINTRGSAPVHVNHVPIASNSTWIWLDSNQAPWYLFPVVWIRPDKDTDLLWNSIPGVLQRVIQDSGILQMIRQYLPSINQQRRNHRNSNKLVVSTFWWNRDLIEQVVNDAINFTQRTRTRSCTIHRLTTSGAKSMTAPPRKMETVILGPEGMELLNDIKRFFKRKEWYRANDLPYQRVYLLYGPPGNGKSSFLQALAIMFRIEYYYLQLASKTLNREVLRNNLKDYTLQSPCIVVLEDVESVFGKDKGNTGSKKEEAQQLALSTAAALAAQKNADEKNLSSVLQSTKADFGVKIEDFIDLVSGMLNPPSGRLIFFTTNHCNRLHEEILRVVDEQGIRVEFPNAKLSIMHGMWKQFYRGVPGANDHWMRFVENFHRRYGRENEVEIYAQRGENEYQIGFLGAEEGGLLTTTRVNYPNRLENEGKESQGSSAQQSTLGHSWIQIMLQMGVDGKGMPVDIKGMPVNSEGGHSHIAQDIFLKSLPFHMSMDRKEEGKTVSKLRFREACIYRAQHISNENETELPLFSLSSKSGAFLTVDDRGQLAMKNLSEDDPEIGHTKFKIKFCIRFSAATMQEHMMRFRREPSLAAENVHHFDEL